MGPLFDRSREHLGYGDKAIIAARQILLSALKNPQGTLPFQHTDAAAMKKTISEIVCASLISPERDKYCEVFYERHLAVVAQTTN